MWLSHSPYLGNGEPRCHAEPTLLCPTRSLLRGADELGLRKAVKAEFGGGTRSFSCEEDFIYENVESELRFFTSQERQSIIRFWLQNLRAKQGETLHNVRFLEDQPISEQCKPAVIAILSRELGVPVRR